MTYQKIRRFPKDRVTTDMEWFSKNGIDFLFQADANLGAFKEDIDMCRELADLREKNGGPFALYYSPTKTRGKNLLEIMDILYKGQLQGQATVSIQHTDPDVLKAMERINLTDGEIDEIVEHAKENDVPLTVQLIMGCPEDSVDKWRNCLTSLVERGIDKDFQVFSYMILPNAPAATEAYQKKWGIETLTTTFAPAGSIRRSGNALEATDTTFTVASNTFTRLDWVDMWKYAIGFMGFHTFGVTRHISKFLNREMNVSYREFYDKLIDDAGSHDYGKIRYIMDNIAINKSKVSTG